MWVQETETAERSVQHRPSTIAVPSVANWRADEIIRRTAACYGLSAADLLGRARTKMIARARKEAMTAIYEFGFSYPEVGRMFGRDHTTVIYAVKGKKR